MDEFDAVAAPDSAGPAGVPLDEPTDDVRRQPDVGPPGEPTDPSERSRRR